MRGRGQKGSSFPTRGRGRRGSSSLHPQLTSQGPTLASVVEGSTSIAQGPTSIAQGRRGSSILPPPPTTSQRPTSSSTTQGPTSIAHGRTSASAPPLPLHGSTSASSSHGPTFASHGPTSPPVLEGDNTSTTDAPDPPRPLRGYEVTIVNEWLMPSHQVSATIRFIMSTFFQDGAGAWALVTEERRQYYWEEFQKECWWDTSITSNVHSLFWKRAADRYSEMICDWKKVWIKKQRKPGCVTVDAWRSLLDYWEKPEVIAKSEQNKKNRRSEPGGPGTGMSCHRGGSRCAIEHAFALGRDNLPCDNWTMMNKFHPVGPDGKSTYGKTDQLHAKIAQRANELRQQAPNSTEPPPPVDMSKLYLETVEIKKGKIVGLGNLCKARKVSGTSASSCCASVSSNIDPTILENLIEERVGERLVVLRREIEKDMDERINRAVLLALSSTRTKRKRQQRDDDDDDDDGDYDDDGSYGYDEDLGDD